MTRNSSALLSGYNRGTYNRGTANSHTRSLQGHGLGQLIREDVFFFCNLENSGRRAAWTRQSA